MVRGCPESSGSDSPSGVQPSRPTLSAFARLGSDPRVPASAILRRRSSNGVRGSKQDTPASVPSPTFASGPGGAKTLTSQLMSGRGRLALRPPTKEGPGESAGCHLRWRIRFRDGVADAFWRRPRGCLTRARRVVRLCLVPAIPEGTLAEAFTSRGEREAGTTETAASQEPLGRGRLLVSPWTSGARVRICAKKVVRCASF